jgi:hypothetical protein
VITVSRKNKTNKRKQSHREREREREKDVASTALVRKGTVIHR